MELVLWLDGELIFGDVVVGNNDRVNFDPCPLHVGDLVTVPDFEGRFVVEKRVCVLTHDGIASWDVTVRAADDEANT